MLAVWCQITLDWLSDVRLGITVGKKGMQSIWLAAAFFADYDYAVWCFPHTLVLFQFVEYVTRWFVCIGKQILTGYC